MAPLPSDKTWIAAALEAISSGDFGSSGLREFCARIDKYLTNTYEEISGETIL